jgi:DNA-binding NarL/FixJ family response regulator
MSELIRILIVDDHPVVRDGIRAMLSTQADFQVVGEASDGEEAVRRIAMTRPQVVLLDLEMPGMDGVETLRHLQEVHLDVKTIVFTAFDTDERILSALQAGARGYLLKGAPRDELFRAIRVAAEGGSLIQPVVATKLLRHVRQGTAGRQVDSPLLTARELDVIRLLAQGRTNQEIASTLVVSERTVKFHVSSILRKLGASNRTEAVALAAQSGIIHL